MEMGIEVMLDMFFYEALWEGMVFGIKEWEHKN